MRSRHALLIASLAATVLAGAAAADDAAAWRDGRQLRDVEFSGNSVLASDELRRLAADLIGREASAGDIEGLRHRITQYYIERGYVNSGALYSGDASDDGILRLRIVEGRVRQLRVEGNERLRHAYFAERLTPADEVLNMNVLQERFQMLMADPLFARVNARVLPGDALGDAVLDVRVDRAPAWQASVFANNHRPPSTGETGQGVAVAWRNLTGLGDTLDAAWQASSGSGKGSIGWLIPFGVRLPQLSLRFEQGDSSVVEEPLNRADIRSKLESREVTLTQPVFVALRQQFSLSLGRSLRDNSTSLLGEAFSFVPGESTGTSSVKSWRFAQEYLARDDVQVIALRSTFVRGRSNALAENSASPVAFPAQRYRVWLGQTQYSRRLTDGGQRLVARLDLQHASERLVGLEKFAVGGARSVRGYRENTLVRDSGYVASLEWHLPRPLGEAQQLDLFPFADIGAARNLGEAREALRSLGIGALWQWRGLRVELAYAHRLVDRPLAQRQVTQDRGVHMQIAYNFP